MRVLSSNKAKSLYFNFCVVVDYGIGGKRSGNLKVNSSAIIAQLLNIFISYLISDVRSWSAINRHE